MTSGDFSSEGYDGALRKHPALLVTDCKRLYGAFHKDGADPSSTDKLASEFASVKSRASRRRSGLEVDRRTVPDRRLLQ